MSRMVKYFVAGWMSALAVCQAKDQPQGSNPSQSNQKKDLEALYEGVRSERSLEKMKDYADQGLARAQFDYAQELYHGQLCPKNVPLAHHYYKLAADQNYLYAKTEYAAILYLDGDEKDLPLALHYSKLAAEQGGPEEWYDYAILVYKYGRYGGGEEDWPLAFHYYKLAAEQGQMEAQRDYAMMLYEGRGTKQNLPLAREYYKRSAEKGFFEAQYDYAWMLYYGEGGPQDLKGAKVYLKKAIEAGHKEASLAYDHLFKD